MKNITDKINFALMVAVASSVVWMFATFVRADEFNEKIGEIKLQMAYGQYYDRLDDYDEATDEENEELAEEYKRQMERIKATICEFDPKWERCETSAME